VERPVIAKYRELDSAERVPSAAACSGVLAVERRYKVPEPGVRKSQKFGLLDSRRGKDERDSFGLFPPQQTKGENAITFTGEIVVGVIMTLCGAAIAYVNARTIIDERAQFGEAAPHVGAWLTAIGLILIGGFLAHGGIIYWCKQLLGRKKESSS